jgi:hypothetical protein
MPKSDPPPIEYQVSHPDWESILQPVTRVTRLEAERVCAELNQKFPGWQVRSVTLAEAPSPPRAGQASCVPVLEARQLMARHGQDLMVLVAWSTLSHQTNIVTVGSSPAFSHDAFVLGEQIAKGLSMKNDLPPPAPQ